MIATIWPGSVGLRGRRGDVGVDVADRDRDALGRPVHAAASAVSVRPAGPSWPIGWSSLSSANPAKPG